MRNHHEERIGSGELEEYEHKNKNFRCISSKAPVVLTGLAGSLITLMTNFPVSSVVSDVATGSSGRKGDAAHAESNGNCVCHMQA